MSDEWGPWIEHDGKGCPCLGMWAQTERYGKNFVHFSTDGRILEPANWDWSRFGERLPCGTVVSKILRYRIRKPRGLTILESLLADLPERVDA